MAAVLKQQQSLCKNLTLGILAMCLYADVSAAPITEEIDVDGWWGDISDSQSATFLTFDLDINTRQIPTCTETTVTLVPRHPGTFYQTSCEATGFVDSLGVIVGAEKFAFEELESNLTWHSFYQDTQNSVFGIFREGQNYYENAAAELILDGAFGNLRFQWGVGWDFIGSYILPTGQFLGKEVSGHGSGSVYNGIEFDFSNVNGERVRRVPEPGSASLMFAGLLLLVLFSRRRRLPSIEEYARQVSNP